ncbi:hypothetical protein H7J77_17165 [Mycolicibacillus parakoreensis]|uniref:Uncharacterized protein n=1 Tax=Mycolicibacillus parakoreensis TaxID=1069221 RepID=A0ABY3U050_9MYCO|nr:hypothetical protein [Mycolicibacillus parakoreensis]MCV7317267.1 hypothetical protein [Mycolicibacillus parakoreensis]ULN51521.1 hypothetical protein MIU77_11445 [Mycolicibacillus parakoreensis]
MNRQQRRARLRAARAFKSKDDLLPAITRLTEHGYLEALPEPDRDGRGRPGSPNYRLTTA